MSNDGNAAEPKGWHHAFAGGASGAATRALFQPLDVLKIRFQLQVDPISAGSKYSSLRQAVRAVLREEGAAALWSGHLPAQCLSIAYGLAQFWCYELLAAQAPRGDPLANFACGAVAGGFATAVSFPFDMVRTRLVADSRATRTYAGAWHACRTIAAAEGPAALFKGLMPTVAQIAPHSGAQFALYKVFNERLAHPEADEGRFSVVRSLASGSLAGFVAKLLVYPFDLAKKRLQIQGFQHRRAAAFGAQFYCDGFVDCIVRTLKREGFLALYKGLWPSLIKATLVTSSHFMFYDLFCSFLREYDAKF